MKKITLNGQTMSSSLGADTTQLHHGTEDWGVPSSNLPPPLSQFTHCKPLLCWRKKLLLCHGLSASREHWAGLRHFILLHQAECKIPEARNSASSVLIFFIFLLLLSLHTPFSQSLWLDNWSTHACCSVTVILWRYTGSIFYKCSVCVVAKESLEKKTKHPKTELSLHCQYPIQGLWIRSGWTGAACQRSPKKSLWVTQGGIHMTLLISSQNKSQIWASISKLVFGGSQLLWFSFIPVIFSIVFDIYFSIFWKSLKFITYSSNRESIRFSECL